jgi:nitroreductase
MVRDYDPDRPVPPEVRERLLEHALRAPSAGFTQGWAFLVLEDAADRELFWSVTTSAGAPDGWLTRMRRAPLLVVPAVVEGGLPRAVRRAGQGLDRPGRGPLAGPLLGRRRRAWPRC